MVDWAMPDCLPEDQETREEPKNWQVPEVDFDPSGISHNQHLNNRTKIEWTKRSTINQSWEWNVGTWEHLEGGWIGDPGIFNTNIPNLVYKMLVKLNQVAIERALEKKSITEKSNTRDAVFLSCGSAK
jgi:hypothetical protein